MKTRIAIGLIAVACVIIGLVSYRRITHAAADGGVALSEYGSLRTAAMFSLLILSTGVLLLVACGISHIVSRKRKGQNDAT